MPSGCSPGMFGHILFFNIRSRLSTRRLAQIWTEAAARSFSNGRSAARQGRLGRPPFPWGFPKGFGSGPWRRPKGESPEQKADNQAIS
jgi:hypothetical protein